MYFRRMNTSSEMTPSLLLPQGNFNPIRLPESDSSTCLAWHAYDKDSGRHLFIKQLRPDLASSPKYRSAFIKEYHVGKKLNSVYFPHYHELEDSERGLFLTMDFIEGERLSEKLQSNPRFFHQRHNVIRLIRQMLEAMSDMHRADIVHLDLKPDNIIITAHTGNVRIVDFGYSLSGEWPVAVGMTRSFASSEQLKQEGKLDVASDIYSFGRIVQEIIWQTGCRLPRYLRRIVNQCLSEQPEKRYASAREILDEIDLHIALKKKQVAKVSILSILLTSLFFVAGYMGYQYYTRDAFEMDGLSYHIVKDIWVVDGFEDVVELTGIAEGTTKDSIFRIPNTVDFHGKEYKVFQVAIRAFEHSGWIKKIIFPEEMRFCKEFAFLGCENLQEVEIQQNMSFLEEGVFTLCPQIQTVKISRKNPYLYVEDGVLFLRDPYHLMFCPPTKSGDYIVPQGVRAIHHKAFLNCKGLTHITIPEGVEKIRPDVFMGCEGLTSVSLPSSVVDIENSVFEGCTSLQHVSIGPRAVILGLHTFDRCKSLREITIPASMIRIGKESFYGTDSLQTVINLSPEPQEICSSVFSHYGDLYVPDEALGAYQKDSIWGRFRVHALSERH